MEWIEKLNKAINYIEEHLDSEIEIESMAKITCCSVYHFQRMFSYIAEVPLSEYIRRRKMTRAALDLKSSDIKIIDVAMKYGYDSPTAFTRAFKNIHGVSPSKGRSVDTHLKAYPPISFKLYVKGEIEMNYRIEKKETFRIVGVKEHYLLNIEENFMQIPQFWEKTMKSHVFPKICSLMNKEPYAVLGVSTCMNGKDFDYYIAASTDKEVPEGMSEYQVPECTWAIFECISSEMQALQKRVVTEWLPTSGYEYADAPDVEVYFESSEEIGQNKCEIWLPIIKKVK
ncbi:AraC family transcriptional regulator [Vallitalea maricola]|uniref:AraC family transcriptional regulator n=1 Tax=Vallitalea maricola TaxID=3074433 RepID=A0ACB5UIA3_9FIRM|nr:AraC family transcriptional regulator [Vallitalea sp. AN17-2]